MSSKKCQNVMEIDGENANYCCDKESVAVKYNYKNMLLLIIGIIEMFG